MPRYPRRTPEYWANLEGLEDEAELDCGCLMRENVENDAIELWFLNMIEVPASRIAGDSDVVPCYAVLGRVALALIAILKNDSTKARGPTKPHLITRVRQHFWAR